MRGYSTIVALLAAVATPGSANPLLAGRGSCPADNCARLVTGTRAGLPTTRLADCSSFLQATVIPPATTTTITVYSFVQSTTTVTTITNTDSDDVHPTVYTGLTREPPTSTYSNPYGKRDDDDGDASTDGPAATGPVTVSATSLPAYASSACRGLSSAYSRACSCAGVTAGVTTALTPTSSVFVSTTQTLDRLNQTATSVITLTPTATATAAATGLPCNATYGHFGVYRANGTVHCGLALNRTSTAGKARLVTQYATSSEYACLGDAAAGKYYSFATYRFANGSCEIYGLTGGAGLDPNTDLYSDAGSDYITKQFYADG